MRAGGRLFSDSDGGPAIAVNAMFGVLGQGLHPSGASELRRALTRDWAGALARLRDPTALVCSLPDDAGVLLSAEHLGQRTVYHTRIGGAVAFATGLRPLLALPGVSRDLDEDWLAAFLTDLAPAPDATPYAAIRRVPPASALILRPDGSRTLHRYWEPDWDRRLRLERDEEYVEQGRALLDQAVRRHMPAEGPIVSMLSGGLDSAGVAATAARIAAPHTVHALTMVPPDGIPRYRPPGQFEDEREHAGAVARLYPNMAWEALSNPGLHPIDENPLRLFLPLGMPARNVMNIGWFAPLFDRARALGAKTILCGNVGNMTLSWDGLSGLAGMAGRGDWLRLWREASGLAASRRVSPMRILLRYGVAAHLPRRVQSALRRGSRIRKATDGRVSAIHPDFAAAHSIRQRLMDAGLGYPGDSVTSRRRWLVKAQGLPALTDPVTDVFGVEMRAPTADIDLLEFCFAVPDEQYIRDGRTRWLARRVLADRLPPKVVDETRKGKQCPEFLHRMTLRRDAIAEGVAALERSPLASRVLDVARMKRLVADWPTDAATTSFDDYGAVLNRGLHIGQFLRWIEGGNQ